MPNAHKVKSQALPHPGQSLDEKIDRVVLDDFMGYYMLATGLWLLADKCPFVNLPEKSEGRWGQGLTAQKMKSCVWLKLKVVVRIDFAEWTGAAKLRHTKFIGLREDKDPRKVVRET